VVSDRERLAEAAELLARMGTAEPRVYEQTREILLPVSGGAQLLVEAIRELDTAGVKIDDVALRRPTLDDVFPPADGTEDRVRGRRRARRRGGRAMSSDPSRPDVRATGADSRPDATQPERQYGGRAMSSDPSWPDVRATGADSRPDATQPERQMEAAR